MDQKSQAIEPVAVDAVVVENSQEKPTININILLASIARKAETSIEAVTSAEKALEIARKWEEHRLKSFKERSEAVISLKQRDPDDIEKRCNNRTRRILKYVIATGGVLGGLWDDRWRCDRGKRSGSNALRLDSRCLFRYSCAPCVWRVCEFY